MELSEITRIRRMQWVSYVHAWCGHGHGHDTYHCFIYQQTSNRDLFSIFPSYERKSINTWATHQKRLTVFHAIFHSITSQMCTRPSKLLLAFSFISWHSLHLLSILASTILVSRDKMCTEDFDHVNVINAKQPDNERQRSPFIPNETSTKKKRNKYLNRMRTVSSHFKIDLKI